MLAVAGQLYGLYRPTPPPSEPLFPEIDKLEHWAAFALPVLLVSVALTRTRRLRGVGRLPGLPWRVGAVFAVHAVLSELVQRAFYARRTGDPFDVLADLVGVAVGAGVAAWTLTRGPRDRT